jgi:hypothetical protein
MKKTLSIMVIVIFCISVAASASYVSVSSTNYASKIISVTDYYQTGDSDYTNAIIRADAVLKTAGGGTLVFPAGEYKIKPGKINISSNIKWQGQGTARIYTQETSLYNVAISTLYGSKNIIIENLIFDQMKDATLLPQASSSLGTFFLHVNCSDNVDIHGCTFYTYGVCAVLVQSSYSMPTNTINVSNNIAYFQRKVDVQYDVSVFNIDGRTIYVEGNYIEAIDVSGFKYSEPRTALEVHAPSGSISGNTTKNTQLGILHVNWPMLWNTYETAYIGNILIANNTITKAIVGIDVWSSNTLASTVTRNLTISGNNINLHLDSNSYPAKGISLSDGNLSNSRYENIIISGNTIQMTVDPSISDPSTKLNLVIPGQDTGALFMNVKSTIDNMTIYNNSVIDFPFSFLNLYRRNNAGENNVHNNINVYNNSILDSSFIRTSGNTFESAINIGNVSNISIYGNRIKNLKTILIGQLNKVVNVTGLTYTDNTFEVPAEPTAPTAVGATKDYSGVIATWANSKQIYVTNSYKCTAGDIIITPNGEKASISKVSGNYIYLLNGVTQWNGGAAITAFYAPENVPVTTVITETIIAPATTSVIEPAATPVIEPAATPVVEPAATPIIEPAAAIVVAPSTASVVGSTEASSNIQPKIYLDVIGTWANSLQIYVTNPSQCSAGDIILTPNGEKATIAKASGNYIYLVNEVTSWYGGKAISCVSTGAVATVCEPTVVVAAGKTYTGVIGTWANSKQIYVTNASQCTAGDVILTPNGEKATIANASGNYIYLVSGVTSWYGGKEISCVSAGTVPAVVEPIAATVRIYTGVIGTWANYRQIYVTNVFQCKAGDVIITPNGQKAVIRKVAGNYIYLMTAVTSWRGGKAISLATN